MVANGTRCTPERLTPAERHWDVVQTVDVAAPADDMWMLVGGFFTLHTWHPDVATTEVLPDPTEQHAIRRFLTFPGPPQSTTSEELESYEGAGRRYRYPWHAGEWGEAIRQYHSEIGVVETLADTSCLMQWQGWLVCTADGPSDFYRRSLDAVAAHFGGS